MRKGTTGMQQSGKVSVIIPVQGIPRQVGGSCKIGRNISIAVNLRSYHNRWRRCINDLDNKIIGDVIQALIHKWITLVPVFEVDIKSFTCLASGRYGYHVSKSIGIWRIERPDHRAHITVASVSHM